MIAHWFRRDLRFEDNHSLFQALHSGKKVLPVFIFDKHILNKLENKQDARVQFIHDRLSFLKKELKALGSDLLVFYGVPEEIWPQIAQAYGLESVYTNEDYEPYARERDQSVEALLKPLGVSFKTWKDQVLFAKDDVLKDNGSPYTVYTPYSKKWKQRMESEGVPVYPSDTLMQHFALLRAPEIPSLKEMGFEPISIPWPDARVNESILTKYHQTRDIPSVHGTSRLGVHLRFGTVSPRTLTTIARNTNEKFLNELIWREFYMSILWHFPQVISKSFKAEYDRIQWRNDETEFRKWCEGKTGYPIVDAGMRELNATGYMHNRVRMIVASFLTKHLLIDWRWGEAYFASKLLDFELASNNGGWQWAAGSGVDAAPYFRVFNPQLQTEKFDPQYRYIKKWVPEFGTPRYPKPMVEHGFARNRCLQVYKEALKSENPPPSAQISLL